MILGTYNINNKKLSEYKAQAKKSYNIYMDWSKLKNYKICPPEIGVNETDFKLCYKTNGLIKFKGYQLTILKTKETFYI
jgi:hypothetical protein